MTLARLPRLAIGDTAPTLTTPDAGPMSLAPRWSHQVGDVGAWTVRRFLVPLIYYSFHKPNAVSSTLWYRLSRSLWKRPATNPGTDQPATQARTGTPSPLASF